MKKLIALTLALIMCIFCFASCGGTTNAGDTNTDTSADTGNAVADSDLAYIQDKGTLVVGVTIFEPLDFIDDNGAWTGFDAEVAMAVAAKLGVDVKFQEISWEAKETELAAKHIDCIWNGLTITPARQEEMSISDPYMLNKQVAVVRAADADKYTDIAALSDAVIAAESGSAGEEVVLDKMAEATYIEKSIQLDALTEVKALTADVAVIDYVMAYYLINKEGSDFTDLQILDIELSEDEFYGIAFRKGSDVTATVNGILSDLADSGELDAIASKYGLNSAVVIG